MRATLLSCSCLILACGGGTGSPDGGGRPDSGVAMDSGHAGTDAGHAQDAGTPAGPCGGRTCAVDQVCCAATGPAGDQCTAPTACGTVRCFGPEDCPGEMCCTDGIQAFCASGIECFERYCRTADDCMANESCCPFGDGQQRCLPTCGAP